MAAEPWGRHARSRLGSGLRPAWSRNPRQAGTQARQCHRHQRGRGTFSACVRSVTRPGIAERALRRPSRWCCVSKHHSTRSPASPGGPDRVDRAVPAWVWVFARRTRSSHRTRRLPEHTPDHMTASGTPGSSSGAFPEADVLPCPFSPKGQECEVDRSRIRMTVPGHALRALIGKVGCSILLHAMPAGDWAAAGQQPRAAEVAPALLANFGHRAVLAIRHNEFVTGAEMHWVYRTWEPGGSLRSGMRIGVGRLGDVVTHWCG